MFIKIWSRDNCSYCDLAAEACQQLSEDLSDFSYEIVKLDVDFQPEDFTSHFPYATTVPQIVVDGKHIGGWNDFQPLWEDELNKLKVK